MHGKFRRALGEGSRWRADKSGIRVVTYAILLSSFWATVHAEEAASTLQYQIVYSDADLLMNEPSIRLADRHLAAVLSGLICGRSETGDVVRSLVTVVVSVKDRESRNESYTWASQRSASGQEQASVADTDSRFRVDVRVSSEGVLGAVFALYKLAEECQLNPCQCGQWSRQHTEPSFELRTLSEEGQRLDLPDVAYRSDTSPYLNTALVASECDYLVTELVPEMLKHGFNSLTILHHDLEEYVTYKYLEGATVYNVTDPHVNRSAALGPIIKNFTDALHALRLTVLFQPYEVSCPPRMCDQFKLYAGSPDLDRVLQARYREFFEATGADGIIVTVSDSWSPRAGYQFHKVWSNAEELAQVATSFHTAVVTRCAKKMIFRLWEWRGQSDWEVLVKGTPDDLAFSVKVTAGDYLLDQPIHPLLQNTSKAPGQRPIMVLVDVFRQYNGWGKTICYVQQWKDRLKQAWTLGVRMLNVWGAWSPGCTWPDSGSQLVNGTAGQFKSWQGLYNDYRVYTAVLDMPFSGARPNAYLMYRLAMNVNDSLLEITNDFGTLHFGKGNQEYITSLLLVTQDGYLNAQSYPATVADFVVQWAVVFNPVVAKLEQFPEKTSYVELLDITGRVRTAIAELNGNLSRINASAGISPAVWKSFSGAAANTVLYWSTLITWKEAYHLNYTLGTGGSPGHGSNATCHLLAATLAQWQTLMEAWDSVAPQQGEDWEVTRTSPKLASRPDFFHSYVSFNDYVTRIDSNYKARCQTTH